MSKSSDDGAEGQPMDLVARHKWLIALCADPRLPSSAVRLAVAVAGFVNKKTGEARPGQDTLAKATAMDVRSIRRNLSHLEDAGWLMILSGRDRTNPKSRRVLHYRPVMKSSTVELSDAAETGHECPVSNDAESGHSCPQNRTSDAPEPDIHGSETGQQRPLSYEQVKNHFRTGRAPRAARPLENNTSLSEGSASAGPPKTRGKGRSSAGAKQGGDDETHRKLIERCLAEEDALDPPEIKFLSRLDGKLAASGSLDTKEVERLDHLIETITVMNSFDHGTFSADIATIRAAKQAAFVEDDADLASEHRLDCAPISRTKQKAVT